MVRCRRLSRGVWVDRDALDFDAVYAEHHALVRRALARRGVRPGDLDDVVQETFVTVHKLLPGFEQRASLKTWLHAVSWRVASGYHRRRRTQRQLDEDGSAVIEDLSHAELPGVERLHDSLSRMHPDDRDLFALHEVGGLSISELAELTGSSRATISEQLERTRRALGRILSSPPPNSTGVRPTQEGDAEALVAPSELGRVAARPVLDCEHPEYCFSTLGDTVFSLWRGDSSVEATAKLVEILLAAADAASDGITLLSMIEPTSRPPNRHGRQQMRDVAAKLRGRLRASAWVIGAQGFGYLAVPIVNSAIFLARSPLNIRFFRDLTVATTWLAPYTDGRSSHALVRYAADMTARLDRYR